MEEKNNKFFSKEVQKEHKKVQKSSCSVLMLVLVLFIILILIVCGLFYLKYRAGSVIGVAKDDVNMSIFQKIEKQVEDQSGEESITITITEEDINKLFISYPSFPLKDPKAKISEDGLIITGKTGFLNVEVLVMPSTENGRIKYTIKEIKAAGVPAPKKIADSLSSELSSFITSNMPNNKKVYIEKIILKQGLIQATGKKK